MSVLDNAKMGDIRRKDIGVMREVVLAVENALQEAG